MSSSNTRNIYRIDCLRLSADANKPAHLPSSYTVPCGMNTIVSLSKTQPRMPPISTLNSGFCFVASKWDARRNDYVPYRVVSRLGYSESTYQAGLIPTDLAFAGPGAAR